MSCTQREHIIRAASEISGDPEIVVIGSQAIHAQNVTLPPIAFLSAEADVYPRNMGIAFTRCFQPWSKPRVTASLPRVLGSAALIQAEQR